MVPWVDSAVKSGATSLMRSAGAAGVTVAVLILFSSYTLIFRTSPDCWHSESGANEKPTRERRVGPEFVAYPHAGARLQGQQPGVEKARITIEYAGDGGASNPAVIAQGASRLKKAAHPERRRSLSGANVARRNYPLSLRPRCPAACGFAVLSAVYCRRHEPNQENSAAFARLEKSNVHDRSRSREPPPWFYPARCFL